MMIKCGFIFDILHQIISVDLLFKFTYQNPKIITYAAFIQTKKFNLPLMLVICYQSKGPVVRCDISLLSKLHIKFKLKYATPFLILTLKCRFIRLRKYRERKNVGTRQIVMSGWRIRFLPPNYL